MARLWTFCAEGEDVRMSDYTLMDFGLGLITIQTTYVHVDGKAVKCHGIDDASQSYAGKGSNLPGGSYPYQLFFRGYFMWRNYWTDGVAGDAIIIWAPSQMWSIALTPTTDHRLVMGNPNNYPFVRVGDYSPQLELNRWYCLELRTKVISAVSTNDEAEARLDGVTFSSLNNLTLGKGIGTGGCSFGWAGGGPGNNYGPGLNRDVYVADLAVNDDSGSGQNSWPGPGHARVFYPASDNARDAKWVAGDGVGTSNLFDALNNAPPVGKPSASRTATTQILHLGGAAAANEKYDVNLESYASKGFTNPLIKFAQARICHGEDISTGTKLLTFQPYSNPNAAALSNFAAGGDGGACGTYPTGWIFTDSNPVHNATVDLSTPAVVRMTRPETASRALGICALQMIMEYIPTSPFTFASIYG